MTNQADVRRVTKNAILYFQKNFRLLPAKFCLISGSPRSGTTALSEWLGNHPDVAAFYESRILISTHRFVEEALRFNALEKDTATILDLARQAALGYYSSTRILIGKKMLLDKEPLEAIAFPAKDYESFITDFMRVFPSSKLLLVIRDPIATVWSMARRTWGNSLTDAKNMRFSIDEYIENWRSCARLVLEYRSCANIYIVQFGKLVREPEKESQKILDFLDLQKVQAFQPRDTSEIGFNEEERLNIFKKVRPQLEALKSQGIRDLTC